MTKSQVITRIEDANPTARVTDSIAINGLTSLTTVIGNVKSSRDCVSVGREQIHGQAGRLKLHLKCRMERTNVFQCVVLQFAMHMTARILPCVFFASSCASIAAGRGDVRADQG